MKMTTNCNGYKITTHYANNPRKKFMEVSTQGKITVFVTDSLACAVQYAQNN